MSSTASRETPIRRQYLEIKRQYPQVILFFRLGDFYETFDDDARLVAELLDITLTGREMGRGQRIPMAGIPYHAVEGYLARLVAAGHRVAICDQVGAVTGRDLVQREVVRVVTPGTVVEPSMLDPLSNNYLAAVIVEAESGAGLAYADLSTGEFATTQLSATNPADLGLMLGQELLRLRPREVLAPTDEAPWLPVGSYLSPWAERHWRLAVARDHLLEHFEVGTLDGFGLAGQLLAIRAAGALLQYAAETQKGSLNQLTALTTYHLGETMALDAQTIRNLELTSSSRGARQHSLLAVLDETRTPMGARLLRRWLASPLIQLAPLRDRQAAIAGLVEMALTRGELRVLLHRMADLERLVGRTMQGSIPPRDLLALARTLDLVRQVREYLDRANEPGDQVSEPNDQAGQPGEPVRESADWAGGVAEAAGGVLAPVRSLAAELADERETIELIYQALVESPPAVAGVAPTIRPGFAEDLDALRASIRDSKDWLASLETHERQRTGIRSLKVSFNKVFGYYIEVPNGAANLVPADYLRKQTLVGAERYITPELKDHEARVLSAEEQIQAIEVAVYRQVVAQVIPRTPRLLAAARAIAQLDVLTTLAEVAVRRGYRRPELNEGQALEIIGARHPVVEAMLEGEDFVPNDIHLDTGARQVAILTGPNMSGKSTYLRTVGLIVLLAQIGAYVPAESARIGLVDRIFTRVGAQDDIATGQSTFMVEMVETAAILHHATARSLVILDEIGRGTSTYDGLAIAQAIVEYLHHSPRLGCRTLFATHYHELTALARLLPRVVNCKMDVLEEGDRVVFLRRVVDGGADRSYGLHVAGLAGIPRAVVRRAGEILRDLEEEGEGSGTRRARRSITSAAVPVGQPSLQLSFFAAPPIPNPVVEALKGLEIDALSPLEALTKLYELQRLASEGEPGRP